MKYKQYVVLEIFKRDGTKVGELRPIEDMCDKLLSLKVYNIFGLGKNDYYVKTKKGQ